MKEQKRAYETWEAKVRFHTSDLIRTSEELDKELGQGEVAIEWDSQWGSQWES